VSALGLARDLAPEPSTAERKRQEAADDFADAEMERLFPEADAFDLLEACFPHWYAKARDRIAAVKYEALEREERNPGNCDPEGMN
jgi:hypothetical protein